MTVLGIDFGTSNTAAAVAVNGKPFVIPLEAGEQTLPTAVFLDFANRRTLYGRPAARAMMEGEEGRFMRALKSVLGTSLAREKRQFMNEKLTLIEVIARFLAEIRKRAEATTYQEVTGVLSGRPVRFHSADEARNAQAAEDLEEAYRLAGFKTINFLPEPEAAALAAGGQGRSLIVDIGGGTSDFTLCDRDGDGFRVLASQGIRLGGTDFDKALSLAHVMPLFGYGAEIGNEMGPGSHRAPRALYQDLASWEKITFVYGPALLRDVRRWERLARDPRLFGRLGEVLEMHLGHDVAYAVEAGKIRANGEGEGMIQLDPVEKGLRVALMRDLMQAELEGYADQIAACAAETIAKADVMPESIDRIVYVGGSSLLGVIQHRMEALLPEARPETSEVFTAVVDGLALAAGRDG
ncbi:Heat shock protein 70 [Thalassovita autumnalis]|uniref:Heat shock protein 70 n=1 Tax=Thalassovita autumnalis TaxID=2072972 RepID=A0A0P1G656_9RHOB|nr:Hsp70 family protein [Thalassovita autumnalis]CUH69393.1 Heat shock protein 70 [Thalassovita autumnalis]CUH74316.1 Heat shock protein 70 [Thalassovita autumnalis]